MKNEKLKVINLNFEMMKENIVANKSIEFAIKIVSICKSIVEEQKEFVLSKQLLRSGTAIGALIREAEHAESTADFIHKMNIALKEANETDYWLLLLLKGNYLSKILYNQIQQDCIELIRLLASIVKTTKQKLQKH